MFSIVEKTEPHISVIIPAYNQAEFLIEAIQSVFAQTYEDYEIIVVDDGSTDHSREVLEYFGERVISIYQDNHGLAGARNTGIRAAQGEYIALLDADDQWRSNYLEEMVSLTARHPEGTVYYCRAQGMDVKGEDLPQTFGYSHTKPDSIYQVLLRANFIIPSTVVLRRTTIMTAGLFDQNLRSCEDWDLWLRLLPEYKFIGYDNCLVRYRLHGKSSTNLDEMHRATQLVIYKKFGIDNGQPQNWIPEKRRAYGGVYRYQLITSIQRLGDWQTGALLLSKALYADPTLALDLGLFYDLALGAQPAGFRGTARQLNFRENAANVNKLITDLVDSGNLTDTRSLKRKVFGTANFALGLVAYNTGRRSISRKYYIKALYFRPELVLEPRVIANLFKSYLLSCGYIRHSYSLPQD